ncbi:hypothetical protein B0H13DRAFT_2527672 [Mycena leptocephala]|nr:hypothetical protein B0H13DRAFT_2527672 [Mycena leptocephala]
MATADTPQDRNELELGGNVLMFFSGFATDTVLAKMRASPERDKGLENLVLWITGPIDASQPQSLEEYANGAGGTIHDLASLAVQTIVALVSSRGAGISASALRIVWATLHFVIVADKVDEHFRVSHIDSVSLPLCTTQWGCGFVQALTTVMVSLEANPSAPADDALEDCLLLLRIAFNASYA